MQSHHLRQFAKASDAETDRSSGRPMRRYCLPEETVGKAQALVVDDDINVLELVALMVGKL